MADYAARRAWPDGPEAAEQLARAMAGDRWDTLVDWVKSIKIVHAAAVLKRLNEPEAQDG